MSATLLRDEVNAASGGVRFLRIAVASLLIGSTLFAANVDAQGYPGGRGQGRGGNRSGSDINDPAATSKRNAMAGPALTEPAVGIERELASLRNDLLIDATQMPAWMAVEHAVRDASQIARTRQRRIAEQRQAFMTGGVDVPAGAGTAAIQELIDDDRLRAELLGQVLNTLTALGGKLDARQSGMLNRRIMQALRDPLGTN